MGTATEARDVQYSSLPGLRNKFVNESLDSLGVGVVVALRPVIPPRKGIVGVLSLLRSLPAMDKREEKAARACSYAFRSVNASRRRWRGYLLPVEKNIPRRRGQRFYDDGSVGRYGSCVLALVIVITNTPSCLSRTRRSVRSARNGGPWNPASHYSSGIRFQRNGRRYTLRGLLECASPFSSIGLGLEALTVVHRGHAATCGGAARTRSHRWERPLQGTWGRCGGSRRLDRRIKRSTPPIGRTGFTRPWMCVCAGELFDGNGPILTKLQRQLSEHADGRFLCGPRLGHRRENDVGPFRHHEVMR